MKRKEFLVLLIHTAFSQESNTEMIITFAENRASRLGCEQRNWCLPLFPAEGIRTRERLTRVRLNWLGTVLDSPDYSYRAAMPRARASFPHPSDDPVLAPPFPLLLLFLFCRIRTHAHAQTAHTRLITNRARADTRECIARNRCENCQISEKFFKEIFQEKTINILHRNISEKSIKV